MHWHDGTTVLRRDDRLSRVRRLTYLIAGAATAASLGFATVLGVVIPGRAATTGTQAPSGQSGGGAGQPGGSADHRSGSHRPDSHRTTSHRSGRHGKGGIKPPSQPPSGSSSPPAVSSGGS